MKIKASITVIILSVLLVLGMVWLAKSIIPENDNLIEIGDRIPVKLDGFSYGDIPEFDGKRPYVIVNGNVPFFKTDGLSDRAYEYYGKLDGKGRCTIACASIGRELMPKEEREYIGSVKPSGWQIAKYDCVDGKYLFNRCHLIGFQLTGENANEKNLITGTRYLNTQGMLPFENMVADYIRETGNHVVYRVTPIFVGNELVARGVLMEGYSAEDNGEGICFNVYCYNSQPEIEIDYANGDSRYVGKTDSEGSDSYVLNTGSMRFHLPTCSSIKDITDKNKKEYKGSREELINDGYSPCGSCRP